MQRVQLDKKQKPEKEDEVFFDPPPSPFHLAFNIFPKFRKDIKGHQFQ